LNYQRIHNQIIERAKSEKRQKNGDVYYEQHHIVPKCLGGSNKKENLVLLTAREHFIVHKLLCEIYPDNNSLIYAYWMMANNTSNTLYERKYYVSSREYEQIKSSLKHSNETKQKMREAKLGKKRKPFSDQARQNIGLASKGRIPWNKGKRGYTLHSEESKEKIRQANLNKDVSDETKQKMRQSQLGKPKNRWSKIYKELTTGKEGHLSELCKYFNIKSHSIIDNVKRNKPRKPDGLQFIVLDN
jgi:hypothetical protein